MVVVRSLKLQLHISQVFVLANNGFLFGFYRELLGLVSLRRR
jgi:hypothetical protein